MNPNWATLCVLPHVLDILGPWNCANVVCKTWFSCKKIYTNIIIQRKHEYETFLKLPLRFIQNLNFSSYDGSVDFTIINQLKSLKKLVFGREWINGNQKIMQLSGSQLEKLEELDFMKCKGITDVSLNILKKLGPNMRKLRLCNSAITDNGIKALTDMDKLEELNCAQCRSIGCDSAKTISGLKNMQKLWLWNTGIKDEGVIALSKNLSLRVLDLGWCNITDEGMKSLAGMIWLETLCLNNCKSITSNGFCMLRNLINLRELDIYGCTSINDDVLCSLSILEKIEELNIKDSKITDKGIKWLSNLKTLHTLNISGTNVGDEGIHLVSNMKNLKQLNASKCKRITDEGVSVLNGLQTLNLSETNISDECFKSSRMWETVEDLELDECKLTNESMRILGTSNTLRILSIWDCGDIDDNGILMLNYTRLEHLTITENNFFSDETINECIQKAKPRVLTICKW